MKRITSNAGHSAKSTGASGSGYKEHQLTRKINTIFIAECNKRRAKCVDSTSNAATKTLVLKEQAQRANASGADFAISHHINSGGGTGIEVFYDAGDDVAKKYAIKVSAALAKHYGLRNRGAKSRSNLYWLNATKMPAILIEWGFIDSPKDMKAINADIKGGVKAVLNELGIKNKAWRINSTKDVISIHSKPSRASKVISKFKNGSKVSVQKRGLVWARIKQGDIVGYIPKKYLVKR